MKTLHDIIRASPNPYGISFECTKCGKCFSNSCEILNSGSCDPDKKNKNKITLDKCDKTI